MRAGESLPLFTKAYGEMQGQLDVICGCFQRGKRGTRKIGGRVR